jgi:hypothetical protein
MTEWEERLDAFHKSDRAAVDLGIAALNAISLLNGGAIVALMAFAGQAWDEGSGTGIVKAITKAGIPFGWGVIASGICFFVSYLYQTAVTGVLDAQLRGDPKLLRKRVWSHWITRIMMVSSALAALILFICGVYQVSHVFLHFPGPAKD